MPEALVFKHPTPTAQAMEEIIFLIIDLEEAMAVKG